MQAGKAQSCHPLPGASGSPSLAAGSAFCIPSPSGTLSPKSPQLRAPPRFTPGMEASWEAPWGEPAIQSLLSQSPYSPWLFTSYLSAPPMTNCSYLHLPPLVQLHLAPTFSMWRPQ